MQFTKATSRRARRVGSELPWLGAGNCHRAVAARAKRAVRRQNRATLNGLIDQGLEDYYLEEEDEQVQTES